MADEASGATDREPNAPWRVGVALLASPLLVFWWVRLVPFALAGAMHVAVHVAVGRLVGVPVRLQLGFGPPVWRLARFDLGVLPGAAGRPDLTQASGAGVMAYLASGPVGSALTGWLVAAGLFALGALVRPDLAPVVGLVEAGSRAESVGFAAGDRVVSVDGRPTRSWAGLMSALEEGGEVSLRRGSKLVELHVSPLGADGLVASPAAAVVAVEPGGAWARSGVRDLDRVIAVDGRPIARWTELETALARAIGTVRVRRGIQEIDFAIEPGEPGVVLADRVLAGVFPGGPADAAGLTAGDRVTAVNGRPVRDWAELGRIVQDTEPPLQIAYLRGGEARTVEVLSAAVRVEGQVFRRIGVERREDVFLPPPPAGEGVSIPDAVVRGAHDATATTVAQIGALLGLGAGRVTALQGPVAIVRDRPGMLAVAGSLAIAASLLIALYNLTPLPGSDLLAGLDEASRRLRGRGLPLRAWAALWIALGALLLALITAMDVVRFLR